MSQLMLRSPCEPLKPVKCQPLLIAVTFCVQGFIVLDLNVIPTSENASHNIPNKIIPPQSVLLIHLVTRFGPQ